MFGIEDFTAIINPPRCLHPCNWWDQGNGDSKKRSACSRQRNESTMSCDHRAVDGAVGSAFLKTFKSLLEDPVRILI